jgi:predicted RNase H-like HicB family nuclease
MITFARTLLKKRKNLKAGERQQGFSPAFIRVSLFPMNITFETELETDGRWLAEVPELPGVMAYGLTEREAIGHAEALALRTLAEQIENNETGPVSINVHIAAE